MTFKRTSKAHRTFQGKGVGKVLHTIISKRIKAVSTSGQDARDFLTLKRRKEGMKRNKLFINSVP